MYDDGPNSAVKMSVPSLPTGYDITKHVLVGRSDCHVTVGFDRIRAHIPRFLMQFHYQIQASTDAVEWRAIARMDHNESSVSGHDVYREGLHIDIERRSRPTVQLQVPHGRLPTSRGRVIRGCARYLAREAEYVIDVFEERRAPGGPPGWSLDGGESPDTLITESTLGSGMNEESPVDDALTLWELSELLAEVEGTTPEAIERGANEIEFGPLEEATVVEE